MDATFYDAGHFENSKRLEMGVWHHGAKGLLVSLVSKQPDHEGEVETSIGLDLKAKEARLLAYAILNALGEEEDEEEQRRGG